MGNVNEAPQAADVENRQATSLDDVPETDDDESESASLISKIKGIISTDTARGGANDADEAAAAASSSSSSAPWWKPKFVEEAQEQARDPCPALSLTRKQRLYGFIGAFGFGWFFSVAASFNYMRPTKFALPYTLGNVMSLLSTGFLWTFSAQCKSMCAPVRRGATLVYVAMLVATLVAALEIKSLPAVIACVVGQYCALLWYAASYIPYGRACLRSVATGCCKAACRRCAAAADG